MSNGMNSMFSNFTNLNTTYTPNPFQKTYPSMQTDNQLKSNHPNKPYEVKNPDGSIKGYFWYYGNSVELVFNVEGEITLEETDNYLYASDVISGLALIATIYNFRSEPVLKFSTDPLIAENELIVGETKTIADEHCNKLEKISTPVTMQITNELSSQLVKGIYYIDLVATLSDGYNETLFDTNCCKFEVR